MATIRGSSTAEIEAPIEQVWAVVEDVLTAPEWQGGLKDVEELERDDEGRVTLVESSSDAKVRTIKSTVRFDYDEEPVSYHDFFSEAGAREAIDKFFKQGHGSQCLLMIEGQEPEIVRAS